MAGFEVSEARLNYSGLENDRNWMLIDEQGNFLSAREIPELLQFSTAIESDTNTLELIYKPTGVNFKYQLNPSEGAVLKAKIWDDPIQTLHPSPEFSQFFSDCLKQKTFAVFTNKESNRIKKSKTDKKFRLNLADAFPFLILGENSIQHLSEIFMEKIDIRRFRPNFIFTGGSPYEEDQWNKITIEENSFLCEKKCARCKVIGLNPDSSEYSPEILKLMNKTRKENNQVFMGMNLSLEEGTIIKINSCIHSE